MFILSNLGKVLLAFVAIIVFRILTNAFRLKRLRTIERVYREYLSGKETKFQEYVIELKSIFKSAHVSDVTIPYAQPIGYHQIATSNVSAFENAGSTRQDVVAHILISIDRASGVFKRNMIDSISPLFWINFLIFLPKHLLAYLNVNEKSLLIRIVQVVWWLVAPAAAIFRGQIYEAISKLFR